MARAATQKDKDAFVDAFTDYAMDVAKATGLAPQVVLGQSALETGWGISVAGNNMFGVKGKGVTVTTHEDYGQGLQKEKASFRAYDDKAKSFKDYSSLMDRLYGDVTKAPTVAAQIAALHASPYATDTRYDKKLSSVVDQIEAHRTFQDKVVNATAALDPAEVDLSGVPFNDDRLDDNSFQIDPVNFGTVDNLGPLPDITPYENINPVSFDEALGPPLGGFDWGGDQFNDFSTDPLQAGFSLPDMATPNFDDVSLNTYDDITAGTAFDPMTSFNPVDAAPVNFSDVDVGSYPDITAGTAFDPLSGISPVDAAPVNLSDVDVGSYPEITEGTYDPASWSADFNPAPTNFSDVATPQASGFHSGFDGWSAPETYTPDMSTAREALTTQGRIDSFADHQLPGISYGNQDKINADIMAEIGKPAAPAPTGFAAMSTPDLEAASLDNEVKMGRVNETALTGWGPTLTGLNDQQAALGIDPLAKGAVGFGQFGLSSPITPSAPAAPPAASYTQAPAPQRAAPVQEAPRAAPQIAPAPSLPAAPAPSLSNGFGLGSLFDSKPPDVGFMNAMANPVHANAYSPGLMDGWTGGAIRGAALGALGGPFGALMGGAMGAANLDGRIGAAMSNQFGGFNFGGGWDGYDPTTMGYGVGYNDRGERSHTGVDNSGNASVGDGSYGSESGRNDNNPQGIL